MCNCGHKTSVAFKEVKVLMMQKQDKLIADNAALTKQVRVA